jgi:hypothetical protein
MEIKRGGLTWPHFVILDAVGDDKHMGHVMKPSSWVEDSPSVAADRAEVRGMMT